MSFFDRFRRGSNPVPSRPPPSATAPGVPCDGRIIAFDVAEEVGTLALATGEQIRFGRSACTGFEPLAGLDVQVRAVAPRHGGGWRATELGLATDYASYRDQLRARDAALGVQEVDPIANAGACSQVLGWIVILLDEPPPADPKAAEAWAERMNLAKHGVQVRFENELQLVVDRHAPQTYVGRGPFPRELPTNGVPEGFDPGLGFVGLSLGHPSMVTRLRLLGDPRDELGPGGGLRALTRIARALLPGARAVFLPQAFALMTPGTFREAVGDLDDPAARPMRAWITCQVDPDIGLYLTRGMVLVGLPDVATPADVDDVASLDRGKVAVLHACQVMAETNQPLADGAMFDVPGVGRYRAKAITPNAESQLEAELSTGITTNPQGILLEPS